MNTLPFQTIHRHGRIHEIRTRRDAMRLLLSEDWARDCRDGDESPNGAFVRVELRWGAYVEVEFEVAGDNRCDGLVSAFHEDECLEMEGVAGLPPDQILDWIAESVAALRSELDHHLREIEDSVMDAFRSLVPTNGTKSSVCYPCLRDNGSRRPRRRRLEIPCEPEPRFEFACGRLNLTVERYIWVDFDFRSTAFSTATGIRLRVGSEANGKVAFIDFPFTVSEDADPDQRSPLVHSIRIALAAVGVGSVKLDEFLPQSGGGPDGHELELEVLAATPLPDVPRSGEPPAW